MTHRNPFANRLLSIRVADIGLAVYVLASIAFDDGSLPAQIARVVLVACAVTELASKPIRGNLVYVWQLAFVAFAASSTLWALSPQTANDHAITLALNAVCLGSVAYLIQDDINRVRLFLICVMVAPPLLMLRVASTEGFLAFFSSRATDTTSANIVGMTAGFAFCVAFVGFSRRILASRVACGTFLLLNLGVTVLSASRKALVLIALVLLLYALLNRGGLAGRLPKVVLSGLVVSAGYFLIMSVKPLYELVGVRIETMINGFIGQGEIDSSTSTRMRLIDYGLEWFGGSPWLGYGGDNFRVLMEIGYPRETAYYSHNNYVELLVGFGVFGLVLFYWLYLWIIVRGLRRISRLGAIQTMILSLLIALVVLEYGFISYYSRFFMLFVVLAAAVLSNNMLRDGTLPKDEVGLKQHHAARRST